MPAKREGTKSDANVVNMSFSDLPQDAILVVFSHVTFPALCRIKTVSKWWMQQINTSIILRLGRKPFLTNKELIKAVKEHCDYMRAPNPEKVDRDALFDKLVTTYGFPMNKWDVSQVTNFSRIFYRQRDFNEYIGEWDVSNGTTFWGMFLNASSFDQDIGNWNVSKATSLEGMFWGASSFNRDLTNWITSNVEDMTGMFVTAQNFNGDVSNFDTSKVTSMDSMFYGASKFNQDVSRWNTSNVRRMDDMFLGASTFNQDISRWDTSNVTSMNGMFGDATAFCHNISSWRTTSLAEGHRYNNVFRGAGSLRREFFPRFEGEEGA